ncbi:SMC-Scp complex subunit ScpB [Beggiatoa leptomitoformis]|uniref:SMC-Scp complex subunit ScpB n=1 Tax=Beggiatoa leptomitoformis TaxID=288004 RepID=A0A650GRF9_9GAMM|nr:SMC-Scp complex subunit ScpB [Beggiatoa leptomitoformis]ALG67062.1 SMC-Scp complex subunit ScpB [Beggiatoa leptomitoformis]QGX04047.1 SMC-Scp complex subunit ScpB [Beggiatoa leptomitoformis]
MYDSPPLKQILEAALLAANQALTTDQLLALFPEEAQPERGDIRLALADIREECGQRGIELVQVASGYRFQVKTTLTPWIKKLWAKRPPRYSRALLETLALIAYRQPITRAEIENIRGVSVSSYIIRTLLDYQWIRVLAHRDTPGKPALYGTTKMFLDYFGLKSLDDLPTLSELKLMENFGDAIFAEEEEEPLTETVVATGLYTELLDNVEVNGSLPIDEEEK